MIPSSRQHSLNASSASWSVAERILHAPNVVQPGVLGADARIIEAGGNRMCLVDLTVLVHQQIGAIAVQDAGTTAGNRGCVQTVSSPWPAASTP